VLCVPCDTEYFYECFDCYKKQCLYDVGIDTYERDVSIKLQEIYNAVVRKIEKMQRSESKGMFCVNCGKELPNGAKFCSGCGAEIGVVEAETTRREINYDGKLHKCANCGELLNSFVTNCPTCGYELRNLKTNNSVSELVKKIAKASSVDEKIELITNFYVPNTKEDIYDFFILAVSNLEDTIYDTDDAWYAKLEQTYHKAKISFGNSSEFDYIEKLYNKTRAKVSKRGISNFIRKNKMLCVYSLLVIMGLLVLTMGITLMLKENSEVGSLVVLIGMAFMISPVSVSVFVGEDKKPKKAKSTSEVKSSVQSVGKDAEEFIHEHYEDVMEQFRELGFKNIVVRAEKKGLLDTEGAVKAVSIAGNSEFEEDDEFDVSSKIIIRYHSKNC